jgi:hypothetical protein
VIGLSWMTTVTRSSPGFQVDLSPPTLAKTPGAPDEAKVAVTG